VQRALQYSWARAWVAHQLLQNATHFAVGAAAAGVLSGPFIDSISVASAARERTIFMRFISSARPRAITAQRSCGEVILFDGDHIFGERPALAFHQDAVFCWGECVVMTDVFSALFAFRGRLGRSQYWSLTGLYVLVLVAGLIAFVAVGIAVHAGAGDAVTLAMVPIGIAFILAMSAAIAGVGIRRLHDRGKSGYWLALYYGVPLWASRHAGLDATSVAYLVVTLGVTIWAFADLDALRGDTASNSFGPSPVARRLQPQTFLTNA
jgi:uncharacterized membrane protein YhaH (DUF805 family)